MFASKEWATTLQVFGAVAPALMLVESSGKKLDGDEFMDVADEVMHILAHHLLEDAAPAIGVFCVDQNGIIDR